MDNKWFGWPVQKNNYRAIYRVSDPNQFPFAEPLTPPHLLTKARRYKSPGKSFVFKNCDVLCSITTRKQQFIYIFLHYFSVSNIGRSQYTPLHCYNCLITFAKGSPRYSNGLDSRSCETQ